AQAGREPRRVGSRRSADNRGRSASDAAVSTRAPLAARGLGPAPALDEPGEGARGALRLVSLFLCLQGSGRFHAGQRRQSPAKSKVCLNQKNPQAFCSLYDQNGVAVPNEESQNRLLTVADTTEQMAFNISSATQVGHQLAVIGDEFNSTYSRKLEDMLFHLAQGMAVNVLKILHMHVWKSIIKSFRSLLNNGWTKRVVAYGSWQISRLPLSPCARD
uniref:Uncharacterized protein n=1 Tax=Gopherus evgoodei TaxID=1825980 RepID=A0A8C4VIC8_9SAUR